MNTTNKIYLCQTKPTLSATEELFLTVKLLSAAELAIANAIKDRVQQFRYIQSHAFKRKILSTFLNLGFTEIAFYTDPFGKPFLVQRRDKPLLFFNLSHTAGITALIVSSYENTGIDIEKITNRDDITMLQNMLFHPNEIVDAASVNDCDLQKENFFKIWVVKECFLKAIGKGFSIEPSLIKVESRGNNSFLVKGNDDIANLPGLIQYHRLDGFALAYTNPTGHISPIEKYTFNEDFVMQP